jgi:hypothetical protein
MGQQDAERRLVAVVLVVEPAVAVVLKETYSSRKE